LSIPIINGKNWRTHWGIIKRLFALFVINNIAIAGIYSFDYIGILTAKKIDLIAFEHG